MTKEKIRQKAIECGKNFRTMCLSNITFDSNFNAQCAYNCQYTGLKRCDVVYGYEHGFDNGVKEGEKQKSDIIIRNVIASLEEIKRGFGTLDEFIEQLKENVR